MQRLTPRNTKKLSPNITTLKVIRPGYRLGWGLLSTAIILALQLFTFNPPERYYFQAEQLGDAISVGNVNGFYKAETDPSNHRFSWTSPTPTVDLDLQSRQPVEMDVNIRSAALAGGPDAPVVVLVNGTEVGRLHPDPENV